MMAPGRRSKWSWIRAPMVAGSTLAVPKVSTITLTGLATPIAYAIWIRQPPCEAGFDDVLGHPAGGVGTGAIHLRRVLAREGASTVRGGPAVGVDDDLAPGEPRVALAARR